MPKLIVLLAALAGLSRLNAQPGMPPRIKTDTLLLEGNVPGLGKNRVYLYAIHGVDQVLVDSLPVKDNTYFFYANKIPLPAGQYRLWLDDENAMDLLVNGEKIRFTARLNDLPASVQIAESRENQCFYYYLKKMREVEGRLAQVYEYHTNDTALLSAVTDSVIVAKNAYSRQLIHSFAGTLAARVVNAYIIPDPLEYPRAERLKFADRIAFLSSHFFDNLNFSDTMLVHTDVFYTALQYYMENLVLPKDEEHFVLAADKVMALAKNRQVYAHVLKIMMDGFEQTRQEIAYTYLSERYFLNETCEGPADGKARSVKEKVEMMKLTALGSKAPALLLPDPLGNTVGLLEQHNEVTLVLFWATWCHHCENMMPKLFPLYNRYHPKGFQVYAVSIDTLPAAWKRVSSLMRFPWLNVNAGGGMTDRQLRPYNLHATPKMIIVNQNGNILFKPRNFAELEGYLAQRFGS